MNIMARLRLYVATIHRTIHKALSLEVSVHGCLAQRLYPIKCTLNLWRVTDFD